jgi:hypothetical protein
MTDSRRARRWVPAVLAAGAIATAARGEQMRLAASTPIEMQVGEAQGMAITSLGRIFPSPRMTPLGTSAAAGFPSQVFAAAADDAGNVFLGTGPDGEVVKVTRTGERSLVVRLDEPLVTALLPLAGRDLLAAAAPGGKIYKVRADGSRSLWCETGERYVWALSAHKDGSIFAVTGDRGRLLRIDRNGNSSVFFDSDETHLVSIAAAADGRLWAGGSARGVVYEIDPEGHASVVYDDELPEARSIATTRSGDLIVAFDAPPASEKRLPALRLRVAGGATGAGESMSDLDVRQSPALQGVIEGLPPSSDVDDSSPVRGRIVRISSNGASQELWRSRAETPFALVLDDRERIVFATGEPAKLWRIESDDEIALLATLQEAQATAFAKAQGALVAATSNPAATYRLEREPSPSGTFLAPPSDAGSVARWGTLSWRTLGTGGRVELFTRTGNCEIPDGTWSGWSAARVESAGSPVTSPEGRFLQWRAKISDVSGDGPRVESVIASYATRNRRPSIHDLRLDPASGYVAAKATVRWSAADPDGDGVTVDVQARPVGGKDWKSAVRTDPPPPKSSDPTLGNDGSLKDGKATWDTAGWEEGDYDVRAIASDQAANPPAEALEADAELPVRVRIDRTAPAIQSTRKGGALLVTVTDAISPIARLEVLQEGRVIFSPRPSDGVNDGTKEQFEIPGSRLSGSAAASLRASDASGNTVESPVPAP